jgi:hypothetical protein
MSGLGRMPVVVSYCGSVKFLHTISLQIVQIIVAILLIKVIIFSAKLFIIQQLLFTIGYSTYRLGYNMVISSGRYRIPWKAPFYNFVWPV